MNSNFHRIIRLQHQFVQEKDSIQKISRIKTMENRQLHRHYIKQIYHGIHKQHY
jgi:hypothetical protein